MRKPGLTLRAANTIRSLVYGLASAGWLYPAYLAYTWSVASKDPGNSFPFGKFSDRAVVVTCIWLGVVIIAWIRFALRRGESKALVS